MAEVKSIADRFRMYKATGMSVTLDHQKIAEIADGLILFEKAMMQLHEDTIKRQKSARRAVYLQAAIFAFLILPFALYDFYEYFVGW